MLIEVGSTQYVSIPIDTPAGLDPTGYVVKMAIIPQSQAQPGGGDWFAASWLAPYPGAAKEVTALINSASYTPGEYTAFVQITASPETLVLRSGPIRFGDARPAST